MTCYFMQKITISNELKADLDKWCEGKTDDEKVHFLIKEHIRRKVADAMEEYGKKYGEESRKELAEWEKIDEPWDCLLLRTFFNHNTL